MDEMPSQIMKWPLAMTTTAFHRYVWRIDEEASLSPDQSLDGRFWDVIWMFHAAVNGTVSCRRIDPCNLLFDFYCIVADPAPWSNERIDATARSGGRGYASKPSGLSYLCITFVICRVVSEPRRRTRSARLESRSMLAEFPRATNRSRPFSVIWYIWIYMIHKLFTLKSMQYCWILLLLLAANRLSAQTPATEWTFSEGSGNTAADSYGQGGDAILSKGIRWVPGPNGWAVSADGTSRSFVTLPAIDLRGTQAITVALWARRNYTTDGAGVLFEAGSDYENSNTGFAFFPDDPTCHGIRAALRGNEGTSANCYTQPSSGQWHHLAVVYDKSQTGGDAVSFYVDGVLQNPTWNLASVTNTNDFGKEPMYLFSRADSSLFSSGTVKDLQIYNRALQGGEVQQIYNGAQQLTLSPAINYIQGNYATPQTPQTTVNVKYKVAQTAGDLNIVVVGWNDSTATVSRVTDSRGNTYFRAVGPTIQSGIASQSIYYAKNIVSAGAGANTVTITFSTAAVAPDIRILEYSGADPSNPVDVTAASSGNSNSSNSGSATTTNASDLIFGANIVTTTNRRSRYRFHQAPAHLPDGDIAEDKSFPPPEATALRRR